MQKSHCQITIPRAKFKIKENFRNKLKDSELELSHSRTPRWKNILLNTLRVIGAIMFVYLFILSVGLLSGTINKIPNDVAVKFI